MTRTYRYGVNIPGDIRERLLMIARRDARTINEVILMALDEWSRQKTEYRRIAPSMFGGDLEE